MQMPENTAIRETSSEETSSDVLQGYDSIESTSSSCSGIECTDEPSTSKPTTERIEELALAKWPYFTLWGKTRFDYVERPIEILNKYSKHYKDIIKAASPLKRVEASRPTSISFYDERGRSAPRKAKIRHFPQVPTKVQRPCPKRICNLAKPRRNWKEIHKQEEEKHKKLYTVPDSALKAQPSARILELSTPKKKKQEYKSTFTPPKSSGPIPRVAGLTKANKARKTEEPESESPFKTEMDKGKRRKANKARKTEEPESESPFKTEMDKGKRRKANKARKTEETESESPFKTEMDMGKRRTLVDVVQEYELISPATMNRRMSQVHTLHFPLGALRSLQEESSEPDIVTEHSRETKTSFSQSWNNFMSGLIEEEAYSVTDGLENQGKRQGYLKMVTKGVVKAVLRPKRSKLL